MTIGERRNKPELLCNLPEIETHGKKIIVYSSKANNPDNLQRIHIQTEKTCFLSEHFIIKILHDITYIPLSLQENSFRVLCCINIACENIKSK